MNEELDSQLSAMFDNELPAAQCELLARRLSRDEELKARWALYAAIGATIRSEGGTRLNSSLAGRVSAAISADPVVATLPLAGSSAAEIEAGPSKARGRSTRSRWWAPIGGVAVAASVAAGAILWVRFQPLSQDRQAVAQSAPPAALSGVTAGNAVASDTRASYVVPKSGPRRSIYPSTQLANYVVAHSEFSSPVNRRNLLSTLMASEPGSAGAQSSGSEEPTEDIYDDAKSPQ
jgi:sigma-E factor negative regulatory protein RseA